MTIDERKALRRKAFWRVADFAAYMGMDHQAARRVLLRYDLELHGMLLRRSKGVNRMFGFYWAALAKRAPDAFVDDPLETQRRVDLLETQQADLYDRQRVISNNQKTLASQCDRNARDVERLKAKRERAA